MSLQALDGPFWQPTENHLRADDANEILAWIDYHIVKRLGPEAFEKSIVIHLSRGCLQRDFTIRQIHKKIVNLWRDNRLLNGEISTHHTAVYRIGPKALRGKGFTEESFQIVKTRLQRLLKHPVPEYATTSSHSARKKRKAKHNSTDDVVSRRPQRQSKASDDLSREYSMLRRSLRGPISIRLYPTPARISESARTQRYRRTHSAIPNSEQIKSPRSPTVSAGSNVIENSRSPSASSWMENLEVFSTFSRRPGHTHDTGAAAVLYLLSVEKHQPCGLSQFESIRRLLSEREADIEILREDTTKAHRTIGEVNIELALEKHRCTTLKNTAEAPTQKILVEYLNEIESLRSRILNKEVFLPFTTRDVRKHTPLDREYFQNNTLDIKNEIDDFVCRCSEMPRSCNNNIKLQDISDDSQSKARGTANNDDNGIFALQTLTHDTERQNIGSGDDEDTFPEGGREAWGVVLGAFLLLFPSFGFMVSIGTLQEYWHSHQLAAYTVRDVGWIPSVFVYLALGLGIWIGPLFDHYGPRYIALIGSLAYVVMTFLLAECQEYWQFLLCCGFLGGVAGAALTTTSLAAVSHWFNRRRGLTQGIAMIGSSCGGVAIPLILRATLPKYGYKWSIRILGFLFIGCLLIGNIFIKARLKPAVGAKKKSIITLSIFRDLRFSFLTISVFGFEVVLIGALGLFPTYATVNPSYPSDTGFYLLAVISGVSCLGRFFPGLVADKLGRFNVLAIMILFTLISMLVIWLPFGATSLPALYIFAALFGFGTGSWMALTPACIGQLCKAEEFGRYYGTLYFIASLATLICIPVGGELLSVVGADAMVGFFCAILALSGISFAMSRWACLGWRWSWTEKL